MNRTEPLAVVDRGAGRHRPLRTPRPRRPAAPGPGPAASTTGSGCWWSASSSRARACWSTGWSGRRSARRSTTSPRRCRPVVRHAETGDGHAGPATSTRPAPTRPQRRTERIEVPADRAGRRTSASRATRATGRAGATSRSACRGRCWPAGWSWWTPRGSAGCSRCTARRPWPRCPAPTRCCWSPTPRRSTPRPSWSSWPHAASVCPNVACVLTKTDLYPEWRRIVELDRGHLASGRDRRPSCSRCPPRCAGRPCWTSDAEAQRRVRLPGAGRLPAPARCSARPTGWPAAAWCTTCWPSPTSWSGTCARSRPRSRTRRQVQRAGRARWPRPRSGRPRCKERSARWQQTLNDGVADLNADIDYDLRGPDARDQPDGRGGDAGRR